MRRLSGLLMLATFSVPSGASLAQGTSVSPQSSVPPEACKNYSSLRDEAERRGKLIQEASGRHAPPDEACKLIGNYSQAEVTLIRYVETNATTCGFSPQVIDQLKNAHKSTEVLEKKVCTVAMQKQGPPVRFNDFGDPALQNGGRLERR